MWFSKRWSPNPSSGLDLRVMSSGLALGSMSVEPTLKKKVILS